MTAAPTRFVDRRTRIAYSAPGFAMALVGIPIFVYLPKFYTDVVGVSMWVFGAIFFAGRVVGAVTDPLFGYLSDRTRSRMGRRRPYLAFGAIPLAIAVLVLYIPPEMGHTASTVWFGVGSFTYFLMWTLVTIPWRSLGPELTPDYDERTALFGIRDGTIVAGTMVAAAMPTLLGAVVDGDRARFALYAMLSVPVLVGTFLTCAFLVRERPAPAERREGSLLGGVVEAIRNRPFRILLGSYTVAAFASNLPASLIPYYTQYVLHADVVAPIFILYFAVGILCLPFWVRLSRRIGKRNAFLWATAVNSGSFLGVFFLGDGQVEAYFVLVALAGVGGCAWLVLPNSMQADVIDYDELLSGQRREGQFVGLWSFADMFAAAIGVTIALAVLERAGYVPNVEQSPHVLFTLRVLYVLVPVGCNLLSFALALAYPIDRVRHEAIRAGIAARQSGRAVADPLVAGRIIGEDVVVTKATGA